MNSSKTKVLAVNLSNSTEKKVLGGNLMNSPQKKYFSRAMFPGLPAAWSGTV